MPNICIKRMITRLKYKWSVLKLACMLAFAANVYLLLRLFSRENTVNFTESRDVAAVVRPTARHPFSHLLPSQDSLRQVQKCTQPKLSLRHDSLSFAFQPMPPLNCSGSNFFYLQNGYLILNRTSRFSRQLKMCDIYAIRRESDFNAYLEKLVETNGNTSVKIIEDFIYIRCRFFTDSDGALIARQEDEVKARNDSQLDTIKAQEKLIHDTQLGSSPEDKVQLLDTRQVQNNVTFKSHLGTRQEDEVKARNDSQLDTIQAQEKLIHDTQLGSSPKGKVKLLGTRQVHNKVTLDSQLGTRQDEIKILHDSHLTTRQDSIDKMVHDTWLGTRQDKVNTIHYSQLGSRQADKVKLIQDTQLAAVQDDMDKNYDRGDKRQEDKLKLSHNNQLNRNEDKLPHAAQLGMKQDKLPHAAQLGMKEDKLPHAAQLGMKEDKLPHAAQLGMKEDKLPHAAQLGMKEDKLPHSNQLGMKEDKLPHATQLGMKEDKLPHATQLGMKEDKLPHVTQLGMKEDKLPHDTQLGMKQDKISHDTRLRKKQEQLLHNTHLDTKQDQLLHDTPLNMKQDKISYNNQQGRLNHKVKVKRDISRVEVNSSISSHLNSEGFFLKNSSSDFNQTQRDGVRQRFVIPKQNTKHIRNTELHSKVVQTTRSYHGSEELGKHKKSTFDEDRHSFGVLRYLEHNKNVTQNTSISPREETRENFERLRSSSKTEHRGLSNSNVTPTDHEMKQELFSFTSSSHTAVDKKVERNRHSQDTVPSVDVEKYEDAGGDTELADSDQQDLSYGNFVREQDDMYDAWDDAKIEEMYVEMPGCDEEQYLVQVSPQKHVFDRYRDNKAASTSTFNVLMFGIDSMSNMAVQRKLPDSLNFLKKDLDAVMFEGYNIVGDGTTQALLPMFVGLLEQDIPDILDQRLDHLDFVWKHYQQRGYVTLYAEDEPHLGVFNLRLKGFEELPTDHYMRYFWQSQSQSHLKSDCSAKFCTGPTPNHHYLFQYLTDFFHKYPSIPHFAVGYSGELSHDDVNPSQYLDTDLLKFLMHFKTQGYLNDTVLILFADHGSRKGKLRRTLQGKIEERLPFMSMVFPDSFKWEYRTLYENLKRNARGLTTPFDVHKTLLDILDLAKVDQASQQIAEKGVSLFRSIPENRTCFQAGVDTHWCTCVQEVPIPTSDPVVEEAAEAVVATINNLTQSCRQQCALLQLSSIHSASLVIPNLQVLKFDRTAQTGNFSVSFSNATFDMAELQITLETDKCRGVFEATVQVLFHQDDDDERSVENQGRARLTYSAFEHSISRINTYGSQSSCICKINPHIMKYCCCEKYLRGEKLTEC